MSSRRNLRLTSGRARSGRRGPLTEDERKDSAGWILSPGPNARCTLAISTGVLADHAPDIVMFDVPPPEDGVRGHEAYRDTWPPFFEWQRAGAVFDVMELSVTAGEDVRVRMGAAAMRNARRARPQTRNDGSGSRSGSARMRAGGRSPTSTIRSRTQVDRVERPAVMP